MKSTILTKYGSPDHLLLKDIDPQSPGEDEVLVKVRAASVNSWDMEIIKGVPFVNRMTFGVFGPKEDKYLGIDMAGVVEQVGGNVKGFHPGDEVFGDLSACGMGAFAEYATAREKDLTPKPDGLTFEQAAAVPHTATLALQGVRNKGQIKDGHRIMINGAGGGSGTFGLQLAKHFGAEVTCVDRPEKRDMLMDLGADRFIDYTTEDFSEDRDAYDLILDVVTYRSIFDYRRALAPGGRYVMLGGGDWGRVWRTVFAGPVITFLGKWNTRKKMGVLMHEANKDMESISELLEAGILKPMIDRTYSLNEIADAFRYFGEGRAKGKVTISMR